MKSLKNEKVCHKSFGKGVITENNPLKIKIQFSDMNETKIFLFPYVFEKCLVLENEKLQQECYKQAVQIKEEREKIEEEKRIEQKQAEDLRHIEIRKAKLALTKKKRADAVRKLKVTV